MLSGYCPLDWFFVMNFAIIVSNYYPHISRNLLFGTCSALDEANVSYEIINVPGVFEIPAAVSMVHSGLVSYDGYVVLGCVIRGETSHYDIVALESARALMDLSVRHNLALGNGILTVENESQAVARADSAGLNKGGEAARAAIRMSEIKLQIERDSFV